MKLRPLSKRLRFYAVFALLACLAAAYATFVEPYWIEVTHHTIRVPASRGLTAPIKIAHLTDLHTSGLGRRERKLLAILEAEKPDVIVITGDTFANYGTFQETVSLLTMLRAPLGVYLVKGNWEAWMPRDVASQQYRLTGVELLWNQGAAPRPDVWLAGVDDPYGGDPRMDRALAKAPSNALRIGLFHRPAYFDEVASDLHLAFAGHTHGGQVRIPYLPALWVPGGSGPYVEGWYEKSGARMYVSRGVGMSVLPIRIACRPEVAMITVVNDESRK